MGVSKLLAFFAFIVGTVRCAEQCLYPFESETRETKSLDGIWNFAKTNGTDPLKGVKDKWFLRDLCLSQPTISMPVPASYNDITVDAALRDHVGTVWYERRFFVPATWATDRNVFIRFGSVHYAAQVWINGQFVVAHEIGHLPFQKNITGVLKFGQENRVTVLCDNILSKTTIPQGRVITHTVEDKKPKQCMQYSFDFFNYAGIHRSVFLFTTPAKVYIKGVYLHTERYIRSAASNGTSSTAKVNFEIDASNVQNATILTQIQVIDKSGKVVASTVGNLNGSIAVTNPRLWWPYLMDPDPGYLYTIEVKLLAENKAVLDVYRLQFGIRTVSWNHRQLLINDKPVYFRGLGRHEDADIRGKGLDLATLTKDYDLMKWLGSNTFRTSHYPYSEEAMMFANQEGFMVIDECSSVDTDNYSPELLINHKDAIKHLIIRDRNNPSCVMWSIANEPRVQSEASNIHFGEVANFTRKLDPHRPITAAIAMPSYQEQIGQHLDVLSINRYNAWYQNSGELGTTRDSVVGEAITWNKKHNKTVIWMEYGADTVEGLHILPAFVWSEEYQSQILARHFHAFDILRNKHDFFIGEFIWNFADFKTQQAYTRVGGNKKGLFTRNRQPKAAAYNLRHRNYALANSLDGCPVPDDLEEYVCSNCRTAIP